MVKDAQEAFWLAVAKDAHNEIWLEVKWVVLIAGWMCVVIGAEKIAKCDWIRKLVIGIAMIKFLKCKQNIVLLVGNVNCNSSAKEK